MQDMRAAMLVRGARVPRRQQSDGGWGVKHRRRYLLTYRTRWPMIGNGVHWAHASLTGWPVLGDEASWRTISGVIVVWPGRMTFIYFRRGCKV